jgi:tetratricopeptide (TPR) repeat protein
VHEVAHLFGGLHVTEKSLLETGTDRTSFDLDPFNRQVLALTRDRDFDRDVRDLPRDELGALVDLYRQAPLKDESDPDTAIRIGYLYLMASEIDEALDEFKRAMEIAPEQSRDILRFAIIPELEAWAEENAPTIRTRYMLAQAYAVAERWHDAALELQPGCTEPHVDAPSCALLGAVYLKAGQLAMAQRVLVMALERDDTLAEAHNSLAGVYAAAGEYEAALASFARAQELEPGRVDTLFNKGLTSLAAGRPGSAEASFREVLRRREGHDLARAKLAVALARQEKGKEARRVIRPFEDRRALSAYVLRDMAEVYFLSGDTKKAHERLQLAKKGGIDVEAVETMIREGTRRPREVEVDDLIEQAEAYYHTGSYDTARALLGQAAEEKPREPRVHYWLGRVAAADGDEGAARAHLHTSLEVDPDFHYSRFQLGWLAYRNEDYDEAVPWLAAYAEHEDAGSNAHYMLGRSCFHLDRLEDSERHLRAAIRKRSDFGNAFYFLARVFLEQGRDEEARRELELAVDSRSLPEWRREDAHLRLARLAEAAGEEAKAERHAGVALRLGASEPKGPVAMPAASGVGRLAVETIEPSVAKVLGRGEPVRLVATVFYDLTGADRGAVLLVPQDAGGASLVDTQPTVAVQRGSGRLVLRASFDAPETGDHVDVFLALHAEGQPKTNAVTRVRYTLE